MPFPERAFLARQHVMFTLRSLKFLPTPYQAEDSNRMSLAYFCLSSLALLPSEVVSSLDPSLSAVQVMLKPDQRQGYTDWVYQQQLPSGGFRGSDSMVGAEPACQGAASHAIPNAIPLTTKEEEEFARLMDFPDSDDDDRPAFQPPSRTPPSAETPLSPANVIQSYTAILCLAILDDDFSRLDRAGLIRFLARCQNDDGSFAQFPGCPEAGDPRSTYSAFALASMLDDWSAIDVDLALKFLLTCERPEGGFAVGPGLEPQGGMSYCAIASFSLASRLSSLPNRSNLLRWLVSRQTQPLPRASESEDSSSESEEAEGAEEGKTWADEDVAGFGGRDGKPPDACYSFWCTAAIKILEPTRSLLEPSLDQRWLLSCQHPVYGGIAREPGAVPDVYHTYLSLAALSLGGAQSSEMRQLDPRWNVEVGVAERIKKRIGAGRPKEKAT